MKKTAKSMLSLLLCASMVLSCVPFAGAAQVNQDEAQDTKKNVTISDSKSQEDVNDLLAQAQEVRANSPSAISQDDAEELSTIEKRIEAAVALEEEIRASGPQESLADQEQAEDSVTLASTDRFSGGTGIETDPYVISTMDDLKEISSDISSGNSAYYVLNSDIDMTGTVWTPIGDANTPFIGHIDGNGYSIKNLAISNYNKQIGLFGLAKNATIENINFSGATIQGGSIVGTVLGQGVACKLSNISLTGCVINGSGFIGGIAGTLSDSTLTGCTNNGHIISTGAYTGGVVGVMIEGQIENTVFTGTVDGTNFVGGITGALYGHLYTCTNAGDIHGINTVGGLAGELTFINGQRKIQYSFNSGNVEGTKEVGGIAGYSLSKENYTGAMITSVANSGQIHAKESFAGGIIGDMMSGTYIVGAYNSGTISADVTTCGGIAGRYNSIVTYAASAVSVVYNAGKVKEGKLAGALIGYSCATLVTSSYYLNEQPTGYQVPAIAANFTESTCVFTPKSSAELKLLTDTLGTRFANDADLINGGYPILVKVNYLERSTESNHREFKFGGTFNTTYDTTAQYYYNDDYFNNSAYDYNEHLATMSLSLALSAFASLEVGYDKQYINAENLLENTGFTNIDVNDYFKEKPTTDSIGVITGMKSINVAGEDVTLIAAAVRGAGYESEWASNLTIGEESFHEGFADARDKVLEHLKSYVADHAISGSIKVWITGYSRAAATANLVAGALDNGGVLTNCTYDPSDIYAYTFETPRGALKEDVSGDLYNNIYNIVNNNDPVPKVAPYVWGFQWYGNIQSIPTKTNAGDEYEAYREKMLERFNALGFDTSAYNVDDFVEKLVDVDIMYTVLEGKLPIQVYDNPGTMQDAYLDDAITKLAKEALINRGNYVEKYQHGIREIIKVIYAEDSVKDNFYNSFIQKVNDNILALVLSTGAVITFDQMAGVEALIIYTQMDPLSIIKGYAIESANECGMVSITEEQFDRFAQDVFNLLLDFAVPNLNLGATMTKNPSIPQAHFPEICLAWVQSMDSYYTPGGAPSFTPGSYRIVRVNSASDISVYDTENQLLSTISSDTPDIENNKVVSAMNADGEKLIYLPAESEYRIVITATEDNDLSYSINEYNLQAGEVTRVINFDDISLLSGESITANIPAWNGEDVTQQRAYRSTNSNYTLFHNDGQEIPVDADLVGQEAMQAYYQVEAVANNEDFGIVSGSGVRQFGNYAKVTATPYEGFKFVGWYADGALVSTEKEYRFKVDSKVNLTAQFEVDTNSTPQ